MKTKAKFSLRVSTIAGAIAWKNFEVNFEPCVGLKMGPESSVLSLEYTSSTTNQLPLMNAEELTNK